MRRVLVPSRAAALSAAVIALIAVAAFPLGCTTKTAAPNQGQAPPPLKGRIIFDMAHGEIFGPDDTGELGQSQAVQTMRDSGFEVDVTTERLTAEKIDGAAGVVLAGPMVALSDSEVAALDAYVRAGGTVFLTTHVPYPIMALPAHWGLPVSTLIVQSRTPVPGGDAGVFVTSQVVTDTVTEGVGSVAVVSGWAIRSASPSSKVVVGSGAGTYADQNRDGKPDVEGPFGLIGVARYGKGTVIISGDDAVFANLAIDAAGNKKLLQNLLELFATSAKLV